MDWDRAMWAQGNRTCGDCGQRFHLAGTEECACRPCESEDCSDVVNTKETTICTNCEDEGGE